MDTILDLIYASVKLKPVGKGVEAIVYPLADPALDNYVLRVETGALDKLTEDSTLTALDYGFGEQPLAPPLLSAPGISIERRQPGKSLAAYWKEISDTLLKGGLSQKEADIKASEHVLEEISLLPDSAYEELLRNVDFLTRKGFGIDAQGDNLLISEHAMRLVDLQKGSVYNRTDAIFSMLTEFDMQTKAEDTSPRCEELQHIIAQKLGAAAAITQTPRSHEELARHPEKLEFAKIDSIEHIGKLPLSATTLKLRETLADVESHTRGRSNG
jgi:chaperonin cofactor prefoldin